MREELKIKCDNLLANYDKLKEVTSWNGTRMTILCASLYSAEDRIADPERVRYCTKVLKEKTGLFSEVRGIVLPALACSLDINGGGELLVDKVLEVHELLKKNFFTSPYLVLAAKVIAERCERSAYPAVIERAKVLYQLIRTEHPFLTGADDYVLCTILALSEQSNEELMQEMETCYKYLKANLKGASSNALQGVSHVLAQYEGTAEVKCQKIIDLYMELKKRNSPFDKYQGLPVLALFAPVDKSTEELAQELIEMCIYLRDHKGFGDFGLGRSSRMVFAAVLLNQLYSKDADTTANIMNSTVASVIAQQIAATTCIMISVT